MAHNQKSKAVYVIVTLLHSHEFNQQT